MRNEEALNDFYELQEQSKQFIEVSKNEIVPNILTSIETIVNKVDLGELNGLDAFSLFKKLEKAFTEAKKTIEGVALDEAEKFGASTFESNGQKYELRNGATRFSFDHIQEYAEKKAELKQLEEKYKLAYKNNKLNLSSLNESTGELLELPKVTVSKSSLIIKNK